MKHVLIGGLCLLLPALAWRGAHNAFGDASFATVASTLDATLAVFILVGLALSWIFGIITQIILDLKAGTGKHGIVRLWSLGSGASLVLVVWSVIPPKLGDPFTENTSEFPAAPISSAGMQYEPGLLVCPDWAALHRQIPIVEREFGVTITALAPVTVGLNRSDRLIIRRGLRWAEVQIPQTMIGEQVCRPQFSAIGNLEKREVNVLMQSLGRKKG
ncbi:MAG TPA: hypothetical protein PLM62_15590 [Zoogloea sp.]|nr:hypothetical protein [Zoogloea sp.]